MALEDIARAAYHEQGAEIRHYSTVRSGLTVFLLTVSLGAFSTYFTQNQPHPFLLFASFIAMLAAIFACIHFSIRTERAVIRYVDLWEQLKKTQAGNTTQVRIARPNSLEVYLRVVKDKMNWLLLFAAISLLLAFFYRTELGPLFQRLHVL
jgi:Na+/melibiose symporter-like transporter